MGEYASYPKHSKHQVKIGTCERMYYLRYDQRHKVGALPGNVDPARDKNLFWRLPFPDEDHIEPGAFENYERGLRLYAKGDAFAQKLVERLGGEPGVMQLHHECGLLVNVPCYHGAKLPEPGPGMRTFWNGRNWFLELVAVKNTPNGIKPIAHCRFCRSMWSFDWSEIEEYIEPEMLARVKAL